MTPDYDEQKRRAILLALVRCILPAIKAGEMTNALRHQVKRIGATYDGEFAAELADAIVDRPPGLDAPRLIRSSHPAPDAEAVAREARTQDEQDITMLLVWEAWAKKTPGQGLAAPLFRRVADRLTTLCATARETETALSVCRAERDTLRQQLSTLQAEQPAALQRQEELGYGRGLRDCDAKVQGTVDFMMDRDR